MSSDSSGNARNSIIQKQILKKKVFLEKLTGLENNRSKNGLTIYIDQCKFYDKPDLTTKWVLKGHVAEVMVVRSGRDKLIVYGAYCPSNKFIHVEEVTGETGEVTASLLITLRARFPRQRLDVVLDNAPWHFGDDMKRIAKIYRIHLHYLPPYSPDLNPIEPLWQWIREEATYNHDYTSFKLKKQAIFEKVEDIRNRTPEIEKRLVRKFKI